MGGLSVLLSGRPTALLALSIALFAVLRFLRWFLPFFFERLDNGRDALAARLKHVEIELDAYREVAMLMIGVVGKIDPDNPALVHAMSLLRKRPPASTLDVEEISRRLNTIPGTKEAQA
jgi:hypothetical protein